MEALPVSVAEILGEHGASFVAEGALDIKKLVLGEEEFVLLHPAQFHLDITNTGAGIVAMGRIAAPVRATCARCLCDFDMEIDAEVEGFWVEPGHEEGLPPEQEVEFVRADETIDLAPQLIEALTIEAPFVPLHDEDCKGLCPECGEDLNEGACDCANRPKADNPFAALADLLPAAESDDPSDS